MNRRLYRSSGDRMLSGVAGGLAEYLAVDPSLVRVVWAVLAVFSGGAFLVVYIVMWIVVPEAPWAAPAGAAPGPVSGDPAMGGIPPGGWNPAVPPRRNRGEGGLIVGVLLIGIGAWFLAREFWPALNLDRLWPIGLVALGALLILLTLRRPTS